MNQLRFTLHRGNINATIKIHHPTMRYNEYYQYDYQHSDQPSTNKWKSWHQWKEHPKPQYRTHPSGWIDYPKASSKYHSHYDSSYKSSTKPLTAFSSDRSRQPPHRSGSIQSRVSTSAVPPGHVSHQSSRWLERRMGSSCHACLESSRQDASCQ